MNWLDFFASIIASLASLAWPAALFGTVYLFRLELRRALPLLRLKHGESEISFRIERAEKESEKLSDVPPAPPTPEEQERFNQLVDISPRAAVLELRANLEDTLREIARKNSIATPNTMPLHLLIRELRRQNLIDGPTSALLDDLRAIGNSAAHNTTAEISKVVAQQFMKLVERAISNLI